MVLGTQKIFCSYSDTINLNLNPLLSVNKHEAGLREITDENQLKIDVIPVSRART